MKCFGSRCIRVYSPIRIRVLEVRIRPFINLCDLNDGFDKVLEEPDQKKTVLEVLVMKYNIFLYFYPSIFHGSGSEFFRIESGFLAD